MAVEFPMKVAQKLEGIAASVRAFFRRKFVRAPLLGLALLLFCAGAHWSFHGLQISPDGLRGAPLGVVAVLVLPSLLHNGIGLSLLARSARTSIPLDRATIVSAYACLAELLPLPGGAIVRAGAVMKAGASLGRSSTLVALTAILSISLGMFGAGFSLVLSAPHFGIPLLVLGGVAAAAITAWLWSVAGAVVACGTLLHRLAGIALVALRLQFAFSAVHSELEFGDTLPFVLANVLGSASSIAPAGLGISEALAALLATTVAIPPQAAFLAVGIDRLAIVLGCTCVAIAVRVAAWTQAAAVTFSKK